MAEGRKEGGNRRRNLARSSLGRNRREGRETHTPSQRILAPKRGAQPLFADPASPAPLFFFHLCHPKSSSTCRLAELRKWRLRAQFEKQAGRPSSAMLCSDALLSGMPARKEGEGCSSPLLRSHQTLLHLENVVVCSNCQTCLGRGAVDIGSRGNTNKEK